MIKLKEPIIKEILQPPHQWNSRLETFEIHFKTAGSSFIVLVFENCVG